MEEKQGFVFLPSYYEAIRELPPEDRLEIYDALCGYALEGEWSEDLGAMARLVMRLIRPTLDRGQRKYRAAVENGKKGGNPNFKRGRRNPYYQKDNPKDNRKDNPEDNPAHNQDKDIDKDIDKDKDKEKDKDKDKAKEREKAKETESPSAAAAEPRADGAGTYQNVFLSSEERKRLQKNFPTTAQWHIDRLSAYLHDGISLPRRNHCEAIIDLAQRDALRGDIQWGREEALCPHIPFPGGRVAERSETG